MFDNKPRLALLICVQGLFIAFFPITHESLWIDELATIGYSNLSSLDQLFALMQVDMGSQTPFYYLQMFLWEKCFGHSEYALRMSNLPIFLYAQAVLLWTYRKKSDYAWWLLLVSCLYPLLWVYLNEARPYITMYAGSTLIFAYLSSLYLNTDKNLSDLPSVAYSWALAAGALMLAGTSLLGAFWVVTCLALIAYHVVRNRLWRQLLRPAHLFPWCVMFVLLAVLAIYYVVTVLSGVGASRLSPTTIQTLGFAAYELLGYSGLGPGRIELRQTAFDALGPYALPLAAWTFLLALVFLQAFRRLRLLTAGKDLILILLVVLVPVALIAVSGFLMHWRVLGRHLIPLVAVIVPLLALGLHVVWERGDRFGKGLAVACVMIMSFSALSMVLAERHGKDDYRAAAEIAESGLAQGKTVWWSAAALGPYYYGLPVNHRLLYAQFALKSSGDPRQPGSRFYIFGNSSQAHLESLEPPDVVLLSKSDIFDRDGNLFEYLNRRGYVLVRRLQAFTVWEKSTRGGGMPIS